MDEMGPKRNGGPGDQWAPDVGSGTCPRAMRMSVCSAPRLRGRPQASKAHELRKQAPDIVFRWSLFLYLATSTLVLLSQPAYPAEPIVGPVYYVAPYGNDSHSKAQAANPSTPWRTLQKAAANVVAGDTIVVEDGIYTGGSDSVVRISDKSGTATNPIRFVSRNRWGATLDGQLRSLDVVALRNSNHIIIEGFEIKSGAARGIRSDVSSTSPQIISHITLRQNWIHHNAQVDPCATNKQNGALGHGVLMSRYSRYWTIDNNLIHNNGQLVGSCSSMSHQHDHGLYMKGTRARGQKQHSVRSGCWIQYQDGWTWKQFRSAQ
jgi:hypothetical protein